MEYEKKTLSAFQEVEDSLASLQLFQEQWIENSAAVEAARKLVRITKERYQKGLVNYFEVVDAERSLWSTERTSIQLMGLKLSSTAQLVKALGGGWDENAS